MSEKGKNPEVEELMQGVEPESRSPLELGYLTSAVLDYYETTGVQGFDEGEGWKEGSEYDKRQKSVSVPEDLDTEIKKAFIVQIKKFQK